MKNKKAFTLIELLIVVSIIGTLASIAIPKFSDLMRKAKEGATRGNIGAIRGSINIYYGSNEGQFPGFLTTLTANNGEYLDAMPIVRLGLTHSDTTAAPGNGNDVAGTVDSGEWAYNSGSGQAWVACTHTDTKSSQISSW